MEVENQLDFTITINEDFSDDEQDAQVNEFDEIDGDSSTTTSVVEEPMVYFDIDDVAVDSTPYEMQMGSEEEESFHYYEGVDESLDQSDVSIIKIEALPTLHGVTNSQDKDDVLIYQPDDESNDDKTTIKVDNRGNGCYIKSDEDMKYDVHQQGDLENMTYLQTQTPHPSSSKYVQSDEKISVYDASSRQKPNYSATIDDSMISQSVKMEYNDNINIKRENDPLLYINENQKYETKYLLPIKPVTNGSSSGADTRFESLSTSHESKSHIPWQFDKVVDISSDDESDGPVNKSSKTTNNVKQQTTSSVRSLKSKELQSTSDNSKAPELMYICRFCNRPYLTATELLSHAKHHPEFRNPIAYPAAYQTENPQPKKMLLFLKPSISPSLAASLKLKGDKRGKGKTQAKSNKCRNWKKKGNTVSSEKTDSRTKSRRPTKGRLLQKKKSTNSPVSADSRSESEGEVVEPLFLFQNHSVEKGGAMANESKIKTEEQTLKQTENSRVINSSGKTSPKDEKKYRSSKHGAIEIFSCPKCKKKFYNQYQLDSHVDYCNGQKATAMAMCKICSILVPTAEEYTHLKSHQSMCHQCGKVCKSARALMFHLLHIHQKNDQGNEGTNVNYKQYKRPGRPKKVCQSTQKQSHQPQQVDSESQVLEETDEKDKNILKMESANDTKNDTRDSIKKEFGMEQETEEQKSENREIRTELTNNSYHMDQRQSDQSKLNLLCESTTKQKPGVLYTDRKSEQMYDIGEAMDKPNKNICPAHQGNIRKRKKWRGKYVWTLQPQKVYPGSVEEGMRKSHGNRVTFETNSHSTNSTCEDAMQTSSIQSNQGINHSCSDHTTVGFGSRKGMKEKKARKWRELESILGSSKAEAEVISGNSRRTRSSDNNMGIRITRSRYNKQNTYVKSVKFQRNNKNSSVKAKEKEKHSQVKFNVSKVHKSGNLTKAVNKSNFAKHIKGTKHKT